MTLAKSSAAIVTLGFVAVTATYGADRPLGEPDRQDLCPWDCGDQGGTYQGDDTTCTPDPCV